jgi:flagellar hook protein FlgE
MSLYGALYSGVSGLTSNSRALGVISENISNVNTTGYKANQSNFASLVTGSASAVGASPGGVVASTRQLIDQQGLLQGTTSATDIALSGDGFFVVNSKIDNSTATAVAIGETLFTRAGSFILDAKQNVVNTGGYTLMGWPLDILGNIVGPTGLPITPDPTSTTDLVPVNLARLSVASNPTTQVNLTVNLPATAVTGDLLITSTQVFDSLGNGHLVDLQWTKTANPGEWDLVVAAPDTLPGGSITNGTVTVTFDANGLLLSPNPPEIIPIFDWDDTLTFAGNSTVTFDFGAIGQPRGVTCTGNEYAVKDISQNGFAFGTFTGVSITDDGVVTAIFDNGTILPVFKLPVAQFSNPNGLETRSGNAYVQSVDAGAFFLAESGNAGAGKIKGATLEASTVDLAGQFTNMIITQRAYSANATLIRTADEMLQELSQVAR